ncbi:MAG: 30S ribosomal protein S8 [Candidatus Uhrbacteria bacterium]|nr:30S ribosomal protein S8 [Candidatus Uhrbacteria bacterium]
MMTDPISDMLTRIRNASVIRKGVADMPFSKMKFAIAKILEQEGYVSRAEKLENAIKPTLRIHLKYSRSKEPAITSVRRISKPGSRIYSSADDLRTIRSGFGLTIVSTPNGLMTNVAARKRRLGGEVICEVF